MAQIATMLARAITLLDFVGDDDDDDGDDGCDSDDNNGHPDDLNDVDDDGTNPRTFCSNDTAALGKQAWLDAFQG